MEVKPPHARYVTAQQKTYESGMFAYFKLFEEI
jgi:hypothetical protein